MSAGREALMREAIALAQRGRGEVEPNPRVGALALQDGRVVGRGWHRFWGGPHAEVEALADAAAHGARPDTLVVTLEPCSSQIGEGGKKTPPCTRAILDAGLRTVVVGTGDPDPRHRGRGLAMLAEAGVRVERGVLEDECRRLLACMRRAQALDRPWTIAKWAMTLDGKTAAPTGDARWISGEAARVRVHELRSRVDAVVVGFRTARADDPALTVRHGIEGPQPLRVVVDPVAALDRRSKLVTSADKAPVLVLVREDADPRRCAELERAGVDVLRCTPGSGPHRLELTGAWRALRARGVRRLLVEGGGGLVAELLAAGCIDQVLAFVAPCIVGGAASPTPVGGSGRASIAEAWRLDDVHFSACGDDVAVGGFLR